MAVTKIDRIEKDIERTRAKIIECQNRLKTLETQKSEQENLEIVQIVRAMRISPQELAAFLQNGAMPAPAVAAATGSADYDTTQEDNEDEE